MKKRIINCKENFELICEKNLYKDILIILTNMICNYNTLFKVYVIFLYLISKFQSFQIISYI